MELKKLIYDILVEEVQNKKLLNTLFDRWRSDNDNITLEDAEWVFTQYMGGTDDEGNRIQPIKDQISLNRQEVKNFLVKYSGEYGRLRFEPSRLKDINAYTYEQLKFLLLQFGRRRKSTPQKSPYFFEDPTKSKNDWIKLSEELWKGDRLKIYDDGNGFRIYEPNTQKDAICFGFYQGYIAKNEHTGNTNKWCVTNYDRAGDTMSNLWQSYRTNHGRTFYFVIDETKPKNDQYYVGALQRLSKTEYGYDFRLTNSPNNNSDKQVKLDDPLDPDSSLKNIYPQLFVADEEGNLPVSKITSKEFKESVEMDLKVDEITTLLRRITETPGEYDFVIQDPEVKRAYINRGNELHKKRSFESLNDQDIRLYFEVHFTDGNPLDVFKSYDVFEYIYKGRGKEITDYLVSRLQRANTSITEIYTKLVYNTFSPKFFSKQYDHIKILEDKNSGLSGIFDEKTGGWLKHNNITYEPSYSEIDSDYGVFDFENKTETQNQDDLQEQLDQKAYIVTTYSKTKSVDDGDNFYLIDDPMEHNATVTLLSHSRWLDVKKYFISTTSDEYDYEKPYSDIDQKDTSL